MTRKLVMIVMAVFAGVPAAAQTRYDRDGHWIYETLRQERQQERREARREERFYAGRHHWLDHHRRYAQRGREDYPTRVYGVLYRGPQFVQRNVTSNVECFPPIEDQGSAHTSENAAQADAEISWSSKVMSTYGAIFADFRNAADRTKTCWRATYNESLLARNAEAFTQYLGGRGYKTVCKVSAKPCQARPQPIEQSREEQRTGVSEPR